VNDFRILDWHSLAKDTLRGFAKFEIPSGMVLIYVAIMAGTGTGAPWASPSSKPVLNRNGAAMKDENGKYRYAPCVEFSSKEARVRFQHAVIKAMRLAHPVVFG
jgi:hypothetical protein